MSKLSRSQSEGFQGHWGKAVFKNAQLGDIRRTRRLVKIAETLRGCPANSLPGVFHDPAQLKSVYRLMSHEKVSHETILSCAKEYTWKQAKRHWQHDPDCPMLIIHDTTQLNYTGNASLHDEIGPLGTRGRGLLCHNSLAVEGRHGQVIGLANQVIHPRVPRPKGSTWEERRNRPARESLLWLRGVSGLPSDKRIVDVCDRGADAFEFIEHEHHSGRRFVIRSGYPRFILCGHEGDRKEKLQEYIASQRACGGRVINVPAQRGQTPRAKRRAKLLVSYAAFRLLVPTRKRGEHGDDPIPVWVVRVWEPHPPRNATPVTWRLTTNEPVECFEDALRVIAWYTHRWKVEEYHKGMKTGYRIEELQFTKLERLKPMIALLSVTATALLQLRDLGRRKESRTRSASELFSKEIIEVLSLWRWRQARADLTIHEFYYALARLGGHQNRRRDKRPGWLVLWRGWNLLAPMLLGARIKRLKCG